MLENKATKPVTASSQRRYNVVLTGGVRNGFDPEQVAVELSHLAKIDLAQAAALLGGAARVVKSNVDQNTATQFQSRFEGIGAQCVIKAVGAGPVGMATVNEAPAKTLTTVSIKDAFEGNLQSEAASAKFPAKLLPVALLMMALPLLYVALVGVVAYHTAWHVLNNYDWLLEAPFALHIAQYVVPSLVGTLLVLTLLKPMLVPGAKTQSPMKLESRDDSLFFSFVDQIVQRSGLPMPSEIAVDCSVGATATASVSGQVTLIVGLPLIGGLSARQLSAAIAHALARYAPRSGDFLRRFIRGVHQWLYRCVFERDVLDIRRDALIEQLKDYRGVLLSLTKGLDWIARKVMWVFLQLARVFSRSALRQMEIENDQYAAGFGGAKAFAQTLLRGHELAAAKDAVSKRLAAQFDEGKLSDHLPKVIVDVSNKLPERYRDTVNEAMDASQGSSICADRERIEHAEQAAAHAIFVSDAPATALLVRYDRLSRQATLVYYRHRFDVTLKPEQLISAAEPVAQTAPVEVSEEHLKNYFAGLFTVTRYLNLRRQAAFAVPDPAETKRRLDHVVQQLRQSMKGYTQAVAKYREVYDTQLCAIAARTLAEQKVAFDTAEFKVGGAAVSDAEQALQQATESLQALQPDLAKLDAQMTQRFELALAMRPDGKSQNDIHRLQSALSVIPKMHDSLTQLRGAARALQQVVRNTSNIDGAHFAAQCRSEYEKLLAAADAAPYPFESNAKDNIRSMADYLRSACGMPEQFEENAGPLQQRLDNLLKCAEFLHEHIMIRLAAIAADVEEKLGVESLKQSRAAAKLAEDDYALPF